MSEKETHHRRVVSSADLLPAPPLQRPLLLGGLVAAAGALAWALVVYFAHVEIGLLAWGIGVAIGAVMVRVGAHGTLLAMAAGALALASIATGKHLAFRMILAKESEKVVAKLDESMLEEQRRDADAWVALGERPTAEQVRTFARTHDYELVSADEFVAYHGSRLRAMAAQKPDLAQWRDMTRDHIAAQASFADYLKDEFHPMDILFVLLGVASAFGLVSKATTQKRVAARQALRDQAAAEAAASSPPPIA